MKMSFFKVLAILIYLTLRKVGACGGVPDRPCLLLDKIAAPIAILADQSNFGLYTGQLLKAEGLNEYTLMSVTDASLDLHYLRNFDVVILTKTTITKQYAKQLASYVQQGGNLIVFCPGNLLADITGVQQADGTVSEGYFKVDDKTEIGRGIVSETMQFHGAAGKYLLKGAKQIAAIFSDALTSTEFPAIASNHYGKGQVVSFLYNLPESIVYMHQGNKAWQNQERDGMVGVRQMDMFVGIDNEENWINRNKIHIPQADEQARLLSHSIEYLCQSKKPLPRFWYFPAQNKSLTILTCDGENSGAKDFYEGNIDTELTLVKNKGGVMTVYLIDTGISYHTVNRWRNEGHEIAVHFDNTKNASTLTRENMTRIYDESMAAFSNAYDRGGTTFHLQTVRNHWITWVGWAEQARIELDHGLHLDFNSYKFDNHSSIKRQDWIGGPGYYTGSGIPMKFAGDNGEILDIYQCETQIPDEQLGTKGGIFYTYKVLLDWSLDEERYAVITTNFHPNANANIPYLDELMKVCDYSNKRGVPLWSGERLYHFLQARDEATFDSIQWKKGELTLRLTSSIKGEGLTFMVPVVQNGKRVLFLKIGNEVQKFIKQVVKGKEYAFVTVKSGENYAITVNYAAENKKLL